MHSCVCAGGSLHGTGAPRHQLQHVHLTWRVALGSRTRQGPQRTWRADAVQQQARSHACSASSRAATPTVSALRRMRHRRRRHRRARILAWGLQGANTLPSAMPPAEPSRLADSCGFRHGNACMYGTAGISHGLCGQCALATMAAPCLQQHMRLCEKSACVTFLPFLVSSSALSSVPQPLSEWDSTRPL